MSLDGLAPVIQPFFETELVVALGDPIKSGKEATVFRCRAHPRTGHAELALKVYRPRAHRSFKHDALYREGSMITRYGGGNTRPARAVRSGSSFGRTVDAATWCGREWEVLQTLHEAGVPVPAPVHATADAILMELFACDDGSTSPPLGAAELGPDDATWLFAAICDDLEHMLALHVVHGDLSPYNVLWNGAAYRLIDFPQAVDPRFNSSAPRLLARDLGHVARFCARFADIPDAGEVAADMWSRFERGEL
ncbi:MAG TPA: RIO1 family regulatory kinase/ATPase [Nannocystaceae bacterium]|nr:RIO1 family regulatory kinase/ATPase [Nannocystaceae bacterium]